MIVILDNGHGKETKGKRSPVWPDGSQLYEWEFNRDIVCRLAEMLLLDDRSCEVLVPEMSDVPLTERCRRANEIYKREAGNCILISIHGNAGGGTGWEAYTTRGGTKADGLASLLYDEAEREFARDGWRIRKDFADGDADKESDFYILRHTKAPAVLTENFFFDNERDCRLMLSAEGRERIARVHFNAIKRYKL